MSPSALLALTLLCTLGCGLMAGVFFAFSTFVMKALERLPAAQGIGAMQSINVAVVNPWFLAPFLGTAVGCAGLAVLALLRPGPGRLCLLAGSALYLGGTLLVTFAANVPRNDALARLEPGSAAAADRWSRYVSGWTAWNHVRAAAALAASALLAIAFSLQLPRGAP